MRKCAYYVGEGGISTVQVVFEGLIRQDQINYVYYLDRIRQLDVLVPDHWLQDFGDIWVFSWNKIHVFFYMNNGVIVLLNISSDPRNFAQSILQARMNRKQDLLENGDNA